MNAKREDFRIFNLFCSFFAIGVHTQPSETHARLPVHAQPNQAAPGSKHSQVLHILGINAKYMSCI